MAYDSNNIFAKIIAGTIPCNKVYENEHVLAFHDVHPQAPTHILVIPKGPYETIADFSAKGSPQEQAAFFSAVAQIVKDQGLEDQGFRCIANAGAHGGQEVPHFHLHILAGKKLGRMLPEAA